MVTDVSHVPPGDRFGPGHKEWGTALWPQCLFPRNVLARAASELQPQGPGVWGALWKGLVPYPILAAVQGVTRV